MSATLLIYGDKTILNKIARASRPRRSEPVQNSGSDTGCAKRFDQVRQKLLRETERFLNDPSSRPWARAG